VALRVRLRLRPTRSARRSRHESHPLRHNLTAEIKELRTRVVSRVPQVTSCSVRLGSPRSCTLLLVLFIAVGSQCSAAEAMPVNGSRAR